MVVASPIAAGTSTTHVWQRKFRAMGTTCHVLVLGTTPDKLGERAVSDITRLEGLWSRFIAASDVGRINSAMGAATRVSAETIELLTVARQVQLVTGGAFNPFLGRNIERLGYDRSYERLPTRGLGKNPHDNSHSTGHIDTAAIPILDDGLLIDESNRQVTLSAEVSFDPGGIGKGFAAQRVAQDTMANGAAGVMVSIGGDLTVIGAPPSGDAWSVEIAEPALPWPQLATSSLAQVSLLDCSVATSTTARRRWTPSPDEEVHHILDPVTGRQAAEKVVLATVIARCGATAEAFATAHIATNGHFHGGLPILRVECDGRPARLNGFEAFEPRTSVSECPTPSEA